MGVGDLIRAVFELHDRGLVFGNRALVNGVNDLGLGDFTCGIVCRIVVFRKFGEAPRPVACLGCGCGTLLLTVGEKDNGHAVRTYLVLVISVSPLFDTVNVDKFGRMRVGDDVSSGHIAGDDFGVLLRNDYLIP